MGKKFEFSTPEGALRDRGAPDGDAHARRLPGPAFLRDRFSRGDDAACDQTWAAFVLTREYENSVVFGDVLATIHRLLRTEHERLRRRVANFSFDREHNASWLC